MRIAFVSALLGLVWNVLAFILAGSLYSVSANPLNSEWLGAGLAAGLAAGVVTVLTSRKVQKSALRELFSTIATYYFAVCVWWVTLGLGTKLKIDFDPGQNGDVSYDFGRHLDSGISVLVVATLCGQVLVPLCWLSRRLIQLQIRRSLPDARPI